MWLITNFGFFSIHVPIHPERQPWVREVRARKREHIEELRKRYCPGLGPTIETPHSDYPFRAQADAAMVADAMAKLTKDIEYSNFKDSVEDDDMHGMCMNIWCEAREALDNRFRISKRRRGNAK